MVVFGSLGQTNVLDIDGGDNGSGDLNFDAVGAVVLDGGGQVRDHVLTFGAWTESKYSHIFD